MDFTIRAAALDDCKDIARMILELAEHEKAIIAEVPERLKPKDGSCKVGYALFFFSYSSWKGRCVYMEDLYVMPEFRGKGIGKALMAEVSRVGLETGCSQLNFTVLDWNRSSLDFYLSLGCWDVTSDLGYHCLRCEGGALTRLAQGATPSPQPMTSHT